MLNTGVAFAAFPKHADIRYELDHAPVGARVQLGTQLQDKKVQLLRAQYSFAASGGALGTVNLLDVDGKKAVIPPGALVTSCYVETVSALGTGFGSPRVAFSSGIFGGDLKLDAALSPTYAAAGVADCIQTGSAATALKMPALSNEYTPTMTITGAALTQGKINVWIEYLLSQ